MIDWPAPRSRPIYLTQALLFTLIFSAAVLPYVFAGPIPLWLMLGMILFCLSAIGISRNDQLRLSLIATPIVVFWFILIAITAVLDATAFSQRDVLAGPLLSFLTLLTFIGVSSTIKSFQISWLIHVLCIIVIFQGIICLFQYFGSTSAWNFWRMVDGFLPELVKVNANADAASNLFTYDAAGRVRGTHLYVHVFASVQAALTAALLGVSFSKAIWPSQSKLTHILIIVAVVLGTLSVTVTFSRSAILGVSLALGFLLFIRIRRAIVSISITIAIFAILGLLQIQEADQYVRLFNVDAATTVNRVRINQLMDTLRIVELSPLFGASGLPYYAPSQEIPIHSVLLRYLHDYGLVGLISYLAVISAILFHLLKYLRSNLQQQRDIAAVGVCIFLAAIADSWTHTSGFLRRDLVHAILFAVVYGQLSYVHFHHRSQTGFGNSLTTIS